MTQKRKITARAPWVFDCWSARPLAERAAFEAQIPTEVLRQDRSRSAVHHEGGDLTDISRRRAHNLAWFFRRGRSYEAPVEPKQQLCQGPQSLYHCVCLQ